MKLTTLLMVAAVGAAGMLLVRRPTQPAPASEAASPPVSPHVPVVENVLHQHQGEDTPMVHAFEQALEEERRHEENLASDGGVHA